jgi:methyltransferase (TIGR00027 family)
MENGQPSFTALTAAAARAAHLTVDAEPWIFADTLAAALLGDQAQELIGYHRLHGAHPVLSGARVQVTCRSRYTEEALRQARAGGVGQYVILGAGLDTFAYRAALGGQAGRVRVFEVDHPATQDWKRRALAARCVPVPDGVTFVAADLATESLAGRLIAAGFDAAAPALFSWLGVTMYLTRDGVTATLAAIAGFAPGTEVIADYMLPDEMRDEAGATYGRLVAQAAAERGEPWLSAFAPDDLSGLARQCGFTSVRHVRQRDTIPAALWTRTDSLAPAELAVLVHAANHRPQKGPDRPTLRKYSSEATGSRLT